MSQLNPRQRWLILGTLLLGTVAAAAFVDDEPVAQPASGKRAPMPAPALPAPSPDKAETTTENAETPETIDPFRSKTWYIAPPPPPPPKPTAPPLPFQFLGQLIEDGEVRVFINHQGRHLVVKAGDVINGTYTVEAISPSHIVFIYQPLQEHQTLTTGG